MTKPKKTISVMLLVALFGCMSTVAMTRVSSQGVPDTEGSRPYVPTKIEWAALSLNASHMVKDASGEWVIGFHGKGNVLFVQCTHLPKADRIALAAFISQKVESAEIFREKMGWGWMQIRKSVREVSQ